MNYPQSSQSDRKRATWLKFAVGSVEFELPCYLSQTKKGLRVKYVGKPERYRQQAQLLADYVTQHNQSIYQRCVDDQSLPCEALRVKQKHSKNYSQVFDQSVVFNADSFVILFTVEEFAA